MSEIGRKNFRRHPAPRFSHLEGWKRLGSPFDEWLHLVLLEKRNDSSFVCEWEENVDDVAVVAPPCLSFAGTGRRDPKIEAGHEQVLLGFAQRGHS